MSELKDKLVELMAGADSVEVPLSDALDGLLSDLRKSRVRLELLKEGLTVDFVGTRAFVVRKVGAKLGSRERWEALKVKMLEEIEAIDKDAVFEGVEPPAWWLGMSEVRRELLKGAGAKPEPMPGREVLATLFGDDKE